MPFCRARLEAPWKAANYPNEINHLGDHIRRRRLDLGLLQKDVAGQIGVHEQTIHHWEANETAPALRWLPGIIQFLGFDPRKLPESIGARLRHYREGKGMSQQEFAGRLGVDPSTLARWEAGRRQPQGGHRKVIETLW